MLAQILAFVSLGLALVALGLALYARRKLGELDRITARQAEKARNLIRA